MAPQLRQRVLAGSEYPPSVFCYPGVVFNLETEIEPRMDAD